LDCVIISFFTHLSGEEPHLYSRSNHVPKRNIGAQNSNHTPIPCCPFGSRQTPFFKDNIVTSCVLSLTSIVFIAAPFPVLFSFAS